jgi:hypothetical protein
MQTAAAVDSTALSNKCPSVVGFLDGNLTGIFTEFAARWNADTDVTNRAVLVRAMLFSGCLGTYNRACVVVAVEGGGVRGVCCRLPAPPAFNESANDEQSPATNNSTPPPSQPKNINKKQSCSAATGSLIPAPAASSRLWAPRWSCSR